MNMFLCWPYVGKGIANRTKLPEMLAKMLAENVALFAPALSLSNKI